MEARLLVETWAVRQVVERQVDLVDALEALIRQQREQRADPATFIDLDRDFHRTIVAAAGNPVLADFYESLRDRQVRMGVQAVVTGANRAEQVLAEHEAIVEGLRDADPEKAVGALHEHLGATLAVLRPAPALLSSRMVAGGR